MINEVRLPAGVGDKDKESIVDLQKKNIENMIKYQTFTGMITAFERVLSNCYQDIEKVKEDLEKAKRENNSLAYEYNSLIKRIKEGVKNEKNQSKS